MKHEVELKPKNRLTVSELTDYDNIGVIDANGDKGFTHFYSLNVYIFGKDGRTSWAGGGRTIQDAFNVAADKCAATCQIVKIFKFDTRKELFLWLAED